MWFWIAILSAITSAISIVYNKKLVQEAGVLVLSWAIFTLSIPIVAVLVVSEGLPKINTLFLISTVLAAAIFGGAKALVLKAIKTGLLSKIYPLNAFSSLFIYLLGLVFLSEVISFKALMGLLLIIGGTYILKAEKIGKNILKPFKLLFQEKSSLLILAAVIPFSITAVLEKVALNNMEPTSPALILLIENFVISLMFTVYLSKVRKNWLQTVKKYLPRLTLASLIYSFMGLLVFMGFSQGPISLVVAIKKLQVVFVLVLSWLLFKDKPTKYSWIGTLIMLAGVILIKTAY